MLILLLSFAVVGKLAAADFKRVVPAFLDNYCIECHGGKKTKADLDLKLFKNEADVLNHYKKWRLILQQITSGEMPPKKSPAQPTPKDIETFEAAIQSSLSKAESRMPLDPGRVTVRRLNRTEYNNTIRDLMIVDFNPAENFPSDDIGHGFDNIGDVLTVSPLHFERYLDAADSIVERAIPLKLPKPPSRTTYSIFLEPSGYGSENGTRPVTNTVPELFVRHELKVAGEYVFRVRASATNRLGEDVTQLALLVNSKEVLTRPVTNAPKNWVDFETTLTLNPGEHRFSAKFVNVTSNRSDRMLFINEFKVIGPSDTRTEFQRKVASLVGNTQGSEREELLVQWFLTKAYRRPPTSAEKYRATKIFKQADNNNTNANWEASFKNFVRVTLCSPKFLFRVELDDRPTTRKPHPLDDFQLASRMSYFIWGSMPDDELLKLASQKKLSKQIPGQIERMLADPKSESMIQNFGLQWLQLERLRTFTPDPSLFPEFNDAMRRAMLRETELFLSEIIRKDRSVLEMVDADFTYLNEPLARLYRIEDTVGNLRGTKEKLPGGKPIRGQEFVRVSLPSKDRGGLLTQASVLTVTSNPTRTSPVKRGKWILEQILGTPPPPPPPGVEELEAQKELTGSLRQRMEQHRANPSCAGCHKSMDAVGFAFENFDAIGRYRAKDGETEIDASGTLPDGKSFSGPAELKLILKAKKEVVARNVTEKLLTYALGRGLEFYDERAIKKILGELSKNDYKFSTLMTAIVTSDPFLLRRGQSRDRGADTTSNAMKPVAANDSSFVDIGLP